ncbi:MAG TPA: DUF454 family protein [Gammaproteobacteria bacterium]
MRMRHSNLATPGKIVALLVASALVVVGVAGLVLPIIPGLLFLGIAAYVAARHFPALDARLRQRRVLGQHLNVADRLRYASLSAKVRVAGWLCVKMLMDGLALVAAFVSKLRTAVSAGRS